MKPRTALTNSTAVSGAAVDWLGAASSPLPLGTTPGMTTTGPVVEVKVKSGKSTTRQLGVTADGMQVGPVTDGTT